MTHDADPPACEPQAVSFEAGLAQLGEIVARLESGSLGLSDSITAYERGVTILKRLHEELAAVEQRVSVLVRIDEDGRPILEPSSPSRHGAADDGTSTPADSTQPARTRPARAGRTSSARSKSLPGMDDAATEA
ncbi:MAG: exodeoxyribonuclease VII small subunit [Planctomycetaceae bacterium]